MSTTQCHRRKNGVLERKRINKNAAKATLGERRKDREPMNEVQDKEECKEWFEK